MMELIHLRWIRVSLINEVLLREWLVTYTNIAAFRPRSMSAGAGGDIENSARERNEHQGASPLEKPKCQR